MKRHSSNHVVMRAAFFAFTVGALFGVAACSKASAPAPVSDAGASPVTGNSTVQANAAVAAANGGELVTGACLSCHTEEMLAQQRLPKEKWAAVVKKMASWGANLDPTDTEALVLHLSRTYGPDAGPWEPVALPFASATEALDPTPDGIFAGGDAAKGKGLFVERCSACHGPEGRGAPGAMGVNLVERPVLYRAADLAATVRRGRGKMTPLPNTSDADVKDILAHLRTLRVP